MLRHVIPATSPRRLSSLWITPARRISGFSAWMWRTAPICAPWISPFTLTVTSAVGEYEIWTLYRGDGADCSWEPLEGVFEKKAAMIGYECTLSWEATSQDIDLCDLESKVFGVGSMSPSYILPEPGASNAGKLMVLGTGCSISASVMPREEQSLGPSILPLNRTMVFPPGDVFYFIVELENPGNICEIDLYLYLEECDLDKSVWNFLTVNGKNGR